MACTLLVASVTTSASAVAQTTGQDTNLIADTLFREGRKLMDAKNYAEACPKLEESLRLEPAPGTLLALASCHQQQGRVASAWGEFNQSLATARRDGRADRESFARDRIAELEPLLPKVTIEVPPDARVPDLQVTRNGVAITQTSWGVALPSDPGTVVVSATANGHKPWTFTAKVEQKQTLKVTVPVLETTPAAAPVVPPPAASAANPAPSAQKTEPPATTNEAPPSGHDYRVPAYVVGGLGVVAIGVGSYFGVSALSKMSDSNNACPVVNGTRQCTQAGVDASNTAQTNARVADITIGVGLAAVVTGVVLYFVSTPSQESGASLPPASAALRLRLTPSVEPRGGGATLSATF